MLLKHKIMDAELKDELKERLKKLASLRMRISDLKNRWEMDVLMYVADETDNEHVTEIDKNLSLMRRVEQKVLLKHIRDLEAILKNE